MTALHQLLATDDATKYWKSVLSACAYTHQHDLIIEWINQFSKTTKTKDNDPIIHHWLRVAHIRLGKRKEAAKYHKKLASKANTSFIPMYMLVEEPGYLDLNDWLPFEWYRAAIAIIDDYYNGLKVPIARQRVTALFNRYPRFLPILGLMAERGGKPEMEFLIALSQLYPTPGLLAFAQGQYGFDETRYDAANALCIGGQIPHATPITLYLDGKPTEVCFYHFDIHQETYTDIDPKIRQHIIKAHEFFKKGNKVALKQEVLRGLKIDPDQRVLLHYLVISAKLGKDKVAFNATLQKLLALHPDYFFARQTLASEYIEQKRLDDAAKILTELAKQRHIHSSEFKLLVVNFVQYELARDNVRMAQYWFLYVQDVIGDEISQDWYTSIEARISLKLMMKNIASKFRLKRK